MTTTLTVDIPRGLWMTSNDRLHWAAKAKRTKAIRTLAKHAARVAQIEALRHVHVTVHVGYPTRTTADPGNAYPVIKAAIDGFTDAGLWPDDDSTHLTGPDPRREPHPTGRTGLHTLRFVFAATDQPGDHS